MPLARELSRGKGLAQLGKRVRRSAPVTDMLARDIQAGVFPPGTWLKQIDLETRYGATRIDVRRALDHLVLKRLVQHVPNRGYHVYVPDERQGAEHREIRVILETAAAEMMVGHAAPRDIEELTTLARDFARLVMEGTLLEQYEANIAFHKRLLKLCPSRELVALIMDIRGRGPSAPLTQWKTRARIEQSAREHFDIIDALAKGDGPRLKAVTAAHICQSAGDGGQA